MKIFNNIANIFRVPELRVRVLFTLGIIAVVRLGCYIPVPGIDGNVLARIISEQTSRMGGSIGMFMDIFSGGALQRCTLFALGVMPYISSTIILQLLIAVVPTLERWQREGESGQKRIREWGRYGTFFLCIFQAFFIAKWLSNPANFSGAVIVPTPGYLFMFSTMFSITAGTILLMWLGEQITDKGVGNGVSIIITVNIVSRLPNAITMMANTMDTSMAEGWQIIKFVMLFAIFFGVIIAVVMITQGERKIPVQYAKRMVGRRQYAGQASYIPFRVNYPGVMPIIFASSLLFFPATIVGFFPQASFLNSLTQWLMPPSMFYYCAYVFMIIFFCFFWTATVFNPVQMADDLRKNSAFIPGIRPGKTTSDFFDFTMTRITLAGSVFLALIAIIPDILQSRLVLGIPSQIANFFGGTSILITVGVMLDTMRQIESYLVARHYEGFMKSGRIKGRTSTRNY